MHAAFAIHVHKPCWLLMCEVSCASETCLLFSHVCYKLPGSAASRHRASAACLAWHSPSYAAVRTSSAVCTSRCRQFDTSLFGLTLQESGDASARQLRSGSPSARTSGSATRQGCGGMQTSAAQEWCCSQATAGKSARTCNGLHGWQGATRVSTKLVCGMCTHQHLRWRNCLLCINFPCSMLLASC
jgi:hypothetical protein